MSVPNLLGVVATAAPNPFAGRWSGTALPDGYTTQVVARARQEPA